MKLEKDELRKYIMETVSKPDKIADCDSCDNHFYIKKFKDIGEMIVFADHNSEGNGLVIRCWSWINSVIYPQNN